MSNLKAIKRDSTSSGSNNKLRSKGLIPAILYGGKNPNQNISVQLKEVKSIINSETLKLFPKHSVFINTSRGSTVDDDALIEALKNKKIYGAGLDVFNNEPNLDKRYLELENCFVLPHVGSATHETRLAMSMLAVNNLKCFFSNKPMLSEVV